MLEFLRQSAVWGVLLTLACFALGYTLHHKLGKAWFNPMLMASLFVIILLSLFKIPYEEYRDSSALISYLMLPATVSLAVPMYEKLSLLRQNLRAILIGTLAGAVTALASISLLALALSLTHAQAVTLLPKSVTTAIGMDISADLGGSASLTGVLIALTGIFGNLTAGFFCRVFGITEPLARGLAIGTSSHVMGTAKALEMGETEGAVSSLAIALAGVMTAILAPIFAGWLA